MKKMMIFHLFLVAIVPKISSSFSKSHLHSVDDLLSSVLSVVIVTENVPYLT